MRINPASLRALRERSGLTTSELARRLSITHSHISNLEAGRREASPDLVKRLAGELQVPLLALLGPEDRNPESAVAS